MNKKADVACACS